MEWSIAHDKAVDVVNRQFGHHELVKRVDIMRFLQKTKTDVMYRLESQHDISPTKIGRDVYWTRTDLVNIIREGFIKAANELVL